MKWEQTAKDVITQHKATREPIAVVLKRLSRSRKLGSHERKLAAEAVYDWARSSWPAWFIDMIRAQYGEGADALLAALKTRAKPVLAIDRRRITTVNAQEALDKLGVGTMASKLIDQALVVTRDKFSFDNLPPELQKNLWMMDEGSQLIAQCVDAKPGERVLDMCAGGGGKTRYLLQSDINLTAMDISASRMKGLKDRVKGENVRMIVTDGREAPFADASFDWVLLDAPCSGTGTLRRAPDMFSWLTPADIARYVKLQKALLARASKLIKPTGKLIYATCSILKQENDDVAQFAQSELGLKLVATRQLLPSSDGCDGFFWAIFACAHRSKRAEL